MNIEGNTYLFYDKCCGDHGYHNPNTIDITFENLYNSDYTCFVGNKAIQEFNKYNDIYKLQNDIDINFYELSFFIIQKTDRISEIKVLCVCVNHQKLKDNLHNIPNKDFLITCCSYHCAYTSFKNNKKNINELIKIKAENATTDQTEPIIEQPSFAKLNLYNYQKRTIHWLLETEKKNKKINYSFNDEVFFGDIAYDSVKKDFIFVEDRKQLQFKGGLLGDEMGLGKTFEMITMSLLNQAKNISYFQENEILLCSKATLILSPNHLSNQWIREFQKTVKEEYNLKIVPMMTKIHYDKTTYLDILDADFVIVSYNFLGNECYFDQWITKISNNKKGHTYINSIFYNEDNAQEKINEIVQKIKLEPNKLFDKNPLINCVKFHRIVIDEFHELLTNTKYNFILKIIKLFKSSNKWVMTGTPFDKSDNCLQEMVNFTIDYKLQNMNRVLEIENVQKYLLNDYFRKNTKKSVENENKLLPIVEEIIKLKFTPTERAIFNAYVVNSNIDKHSILVRQLCCDPRIVSELKDQLSGCKTPEDIQRTMVEHYKKTMDKAAKKIRFIQYRIKKCERNIKVVEYRRYRKYLKQIGYKVKIEYPEKIVDPEFDKYNNEDDDNNDINDNINDNIEDSDNESDDDDTDKPEIIVNQENIKNILKEISKQLNSNPSITLNNMKENLIKLNDRLKDAEKDHQGKKATSEFFTNMLEKINKIMEKKKKKLENGSDSDSDDENEDETCSICLNEITGDDVGVTKCGHMFCFQYVANTVLIAIVMHLQYFI
jgi:hypothetical protein